VREIGYVMSGAEHTIIPFTLKVNEKVEVGDYVLIEHPHRPNTFVLARVMLVKPYNPEMKAGRPGPHEASRGGRVRYGNWMEYRVAYAEPLGYYDEEGKWRSLECPPSSWEPVYEPTEEELQRFFKPQKGRDGLLITIGHVSKHKSIPVQIDLSEVAKGHMFICGMTRSGKSTFVVNLAINAMNTRPSPRIIIIDRRGEYSVLSEYGAMVFDYRVFLPRPRDVQPGLLADVLADLLGVPSGDKTIRDYMVRVVSMIKRDMEKGEPVDFTPDALADYVDRLPGRIQEGTRERLRLYLDKERLERLYLLRQDRPFYDIVEVVMANPIVVIDLSTDPNIIYQHLTVAHMIRRVVHHAIERARRKKPFAAIFVVEEAQYLAPEKGMRIEVGAPEKLGVEKALVEGVSQAGGYNVGFIIMTQRPAYVMKSVISQCNTILCFRLRNPNDQDTVSRYTEYGGERLTAYMPGLADFEGILCGMASTIPFPVIVETKVMEYPRKATVTAKEAWAYMDKEAGLTREELAQALGPDEGAQEAKEVLAPALAVPAEAESTEVAVKAMAEAAVAPASELAPEEAGAPEPEVSDAVGETDLPLSGEAAEEGMPSPPEPSREEASEEGVRQEVPATSAEGGGSPRPEVGGEGGGEAGGAQEPPSKDEKPRESEGERRRRRRLVIDLFEPAI